MGEHAGYPPRSAARQWPRGDVRLCLVQRQDAGPRRAGAVREGQRVLFRLLNAGATENVRLALPGHRMTVIALDGNPVPSPQGVDVLFLAPAERADVIVEMNRPGVWIFGEVSEDWRRKGLGIVVEYANQRGEPQWTAAP